MLCLALCLGCELCLFTIIGTIYKIHKCTVHTHLRQLDKLTLGETELTQYVHNKVYLSEEEHTEYGHRKYRLGH